VLSIETDPGFDYISESWDTLGRELEGLPYPDIDNEISVNGAS
jgi:hypothetical protein